jgi:transposase
LSANIASLAREAGAPKPEPCGEYATLEELQAENTRLRKQFKRAELEREILKKATAHRDL